MNTNDTAKKLSHEEYIILHDAFRMGYVYTHHEVDEYTRNDEVEEKSIILELEDNEILYLSKSDSDEIFHYYKLTQFGDKVYKAYKKIHNLPKKRKLNFIRTKVARYVWVEGEVFREEEGIIEEIPRLRENSFNFIDWDGLYGEKGEFITKAYGMDWIQSFSSSEYEIISEDEAKKQQEINDMKYELIAEKRRAKQQEFLKKQQLEKESAERYERFYNW